MDAAKTGAFIAAMRRERNMTQAELAAVLHVTDKAVSKWERGAGLPDINLIEPLAAALDVSVLELMQGRRIAAETVCRAEAAEMLTDILGMAAASSRQTGFCPVFSKASACCSCCALYIAECSSIQEYHFGAPSARWFLWRLSCSLNSLYIGHRISDHNKYSKPPEIFRGFFINGYRLQYRISGI